MSKRRLDASSNVFQQVLGLQRDRKAFDDDPDGSKHKLARWQSCQRRDGSAPAAPSATTPAAAPAPAPAAARSRASRAWSLEREVLLEPGPAAAAGPVCCVVRPLTTDDVPALRAFGLRGLSVTSRALFAPYNWEASSLDDELNTAAQHSLSHRDLHLVAVSGGEVLGYAFLWAMADDIPELGLAVADAHQRRGLGRALLLLLCQVAQAEGRWAVELTTMQHNARALAVYEKAGFERLGVIRNPLGCDVTAAFAGDATPTAFADELQLVKVLGRGRRTEVLGRLEAKRRRAAALFGSPANE